MSDKDAERWESYDGAAKYSEQIVDEPRKSLLQALISCSETSTPTVLYGPPGTGKTRAVQLLVNELRSKNRIGRVETVQFHRRFSYEDFIEGYIPTSSGFGRRDGIFKEFCKSPSPANFVDVFIIDEMNRADLASTLGEVLFALEDRSIRSIKTAHFGDKLQIPNNLFLVGTMNTADKSIAQVDFAVRRRFRFLPVFPDYVELSLWLSRFTWCVDQFSLDDYVNFARRTNRRILLDRALGAHMQLGQSIFVPRMEKKAEITLEDLVISFEEAVLGQIESYLGMGNVEALGTVFNNSIASQFVSSRIVSSSSFVGLVRESITDQS